MDNYYDIINLPHHVSTEHPRMSMYNRAAQFSPFAAVTGYEKAIEEARKKQEEIVRRRNAPVDESDNGNMSTNLNTAQDEEL